MLAGVDTRQVRIVHKFFPADAVNFNGGNQNGGIFQQLARQYRIWPQVQRTLLARTTQPTLEDWVQMFQSAGVDLTRVRNDLKTKSPTLMGHLEQDRKLAEKALIEVVPAFYLNDYFVDGKLLTLGTLNRSIQRLQAGKPILVASDF